MNLFNPDTTLTDKVYETGRFVLIWKLSVVLCLIFSITTLLFFSFDSIVFTMYLLMFLTSVFSLFYLKKYKKAKPIYWLYTIMASIILIGSFHTLHHVLHYEDILWTFCILLFAFIGLDYKHAIAIAFIHVISLVLFIFFSLNTNIETVSAIPSYQLLVFCFEILFSFTVIIILVRHFLKYQNFTRIELGKTRVKYENVIENINEALIQDDKEGKIIFWNNKFLKMFECSEKEMTEMYITDIINKEYHGTIHLRHRRRLNGILGDDCFMYQGKTRKGNNIWMEINVSPIYENDEIIGTQSLIRDVTVKKEQELQLIRINKELIKIEESERERIAYEIHDGLNQMLVAARLHAQLSSSKDKLLEMIDGAISESKIITHNLVPKDINEFGLIGAIKLLTEKISETGNLNINFICNDESDFYKLTEHIQFNIYRIVQECLSNTIKHAEADLVHIVIESYENNLTILFSNDGEIIPEEKLNNQNFLIAVKRRVNILNGNFKITHNQSGKVSYLITIPVDCEVITLKQVI